MITRTIPNLSRLAKRSHCLHLLGPEHVLEGNTVQVSSLPGSHCSRDCQHRILDTLICGQERMDIAAESRSSFVGNCSFCDLS